MLYIRVDVNKYIATGHIVRCLSIADAAKKLGEDATFIMADEYAVNLVESKGYNTIILNTRWNDMDGEIDCILSLLQKFGIKRILVDSYMVTEKYLRALSAATKVVYIDDLDKFNYPVDTLICYASYYEKFNYPIKYPFTKLLLGMKYAPLRQEFSGLGRKKIRDKIVNILVLSGGTDSLNVLRQILDTLKSFNEIHIDAICGIYNQNFEMLSDRYRQNKNITLHRANDNIISFMQLADTAISAGGTTLYELCACGTPTISYVIADNQIENTTWFAQNNLISFAGDARKDNVGDNIVRILPEYRNRAYRKNLSLKIQRIVDGYGAKRIVELLLKHDRG